MWTSGEIDAVRRAAVVLCGFGRAELSGQLAAIADKMAEGVENEHVWGCAGGGGRDHRVVSSVGVYPASSRAAMTGEAGLVVAYVVMLLVVVAFALSVSFYYTF
jgi:hypothetical protein